MENQKQLVLDVLRRHKVGVLSTISADGSPEAAAIEFGSTDNLELIFDTYTNYRKYTNLQSNSRIAFVVWEEDITVQYEGVAVEISDEKILQKIKSTFFSQIPGAKKFDQLPNTRFFKVSPTWVRYRDYAVSPEPLFELHL